MNPVLTLDHVSYSYHTPSGETPALKDVSFSVRPGTSSSERHRFRSGPYS